MENQKEIWIKIIELNCYYEISSLGNVKSDASNSLKIDSSAISKVCRNINKTAGGYKWSYKNQKEARELNYLK